MSDPNAFLATIRELGARIIQGGTSAETADILGLRLADAIHNLDLWLTSGGVFPSSWNPSIIAWLRSQCDDDEWEDVKHLAHRLEKQPTYREVTVKVKVREDEVSSLTDGLNEWFRPAEDAGLIQTWKYEGHR